MSDIIIKQCTYDNKEIYVGKYVDIQKLLNIITDLSVICDKGIFITIHESVLDVYIKVLIDLGFKFHHYLNNEYSYYIWNNKIIENKIPDMATSSEGVAVMILSPDMKDVLLVYEYDKWKFVTGGVKLENTVIETCIQEVKEEVDIDIDSTFKPIYLGGWVLKNAKYNVINDTLSCFVFKSLSKNFKVDGVEITIANWFPIDYLLNIKSDDDLTSHTSIVIYNKMKFSLIMLKWIKNYINGKHMDIAVSGNTTAIF